jgi:GNAT superfamily N-acetyltransferase
MIFKDGDSYIEVVKKNNDAIVMKFFVDPTHRRKKIGTRLLKNAEWWAQENNCSTIYFPCHEFGDAVMKTYESLGYKMIQITYMKEVSQCLG